MQICIFPGKEEYKEQRKAYEELQEPIGRIRYEIPTYIKFYSIYQYDRLKFRELMNEWLKTEEGKNRTLESLVRKQRKILDICYIRDEEGNPKRDCDENNIFRAGTLQRIHEQIFQELGFNPFIKGSYEVNNLIVHPEEMQAEIKDTWQLPLKDRLKLHIKLLRRLRGEK